MEGHDVDVSAAEGVVTLTINKHVLALQRLENELKSIAEKVPGVIAVRPKWARDITRLTYIENTISRYLKSPARGR